MRGSALVVLLAAISLAAGIGIVSSAQVVDPTACENTCYERQTRCVTACGSHADPIECEAQCQDQVEDCLARCGG
jgi:hypothetical protein